MRAKRFLAAAMCLGGVACGNRVPHDDVVNAAGRAIVRAAPASGQEAQQSVTASEPESDGSSVSDAGTSTGPVQASPTGGGGVATTTTLVPRIAGGGSKSPIIIGSVSTLSGPAGEVERRAVEAVQAWTRATNAKGGLGRRQVRYTVADDGADPARHLALTREFVEQRKVIAFVYSGEALSGASTVDYITAKRVAVIGSEGGAAHFYKSPMYFPQASSGNVLYYSVIAATAQQSLPQGKKRLAALSCAEAQSCADADRLWPTYAKANGLDLVYRARPSIAQPDYTAECLAARNAGADVMLMLMDTNSVGRIATSCTRQGYRPLFSIPTAAASNRQKDDPNLEGAVIGVVTFPWTLGGTPATNEFQSVMKQYAPKSELSAASALGWVAAKMFERAAANLSEPPAPAGVLDGLWTLRDDTLNGLTLPLSFTRNKNAPEMACWFLMQIHNRQFTTPAKDKTFCRH